MVRSSEASRCFLSSRVHAGSHPDFGAAGSRPALLIGAARETGKRGLDGVLRLLRAG